MRTLAQGYKGLSFLASLNSDRFLVAGVLVLALYAGAFIASI